MLSDNITILNYFSIGLGLVLLSVIAPFVSPIQINYVKVPSAVKNDTGSPITLDCDYSIRPDDEELVVKWFLNDELVYQWIPAKKPQATGVLKDRLELAFKATDDPSSVHRALRILNPTTDLAGEYRCAVSTLLDEDFSSKNMIVFEPEKSMTITKEEPHNSKNVNFTCTAKSVYPAPKLTLYKEKSDEFSNKRRNPLQILEWNTRKTHNGKYSVFVIASAQIEELNPGTLIHCELRIPGTGYVKKRNLLYYPPVPQNGCGQQIRATSEFLIIFLFPALSLILHTSEI